MRDVNATSDASIVQVTTDATPHTTVTALLGWPVGETRDTQLENGRTLSRATAKTNRDEATIAIAVFCEGYGG